MQKINKKINKIAIVIFVLANLCFVRSVLAAGKLLQEADLIYDGAFRVPSGNLGMVSPPKSNILSYGGVGLGFIPEHNTLMLNGGTTAGNIMVELNVVSPIIDSNISNLNTATIYQAPVDLAFPHWWELGENGENVPGYGENAACSEVGVPWDCCTGLAIGTCGNSGTSKGIIGGFFSYGGRGIGSVTQSYANSAYRSHYIFNLNRSVVNGFQGFYEVGINPIDPAYRSAPFVGGAMALIPEEWQTALGGPVLTGACCQSMISETSSGPSAWVFNPDNLGSIGDVVSAAMLVGYPAGHTTLGEYSTDIDVEQKYFHQGSTEKGILFAQNTDSVLFFGTFGLGRNADGTPANGKNCYGAGTGTLSETKTKDEVVAWLAVPENANSDQYCLSGTTPGYKCGNGCATSGNACCYDLSYTVGSKGPHVDPFVYRIMAYDANDMLRVKNGDTIKDQTDLAKFTKDGLNPTLSVGDQIKAWNLVPYAIWNLDLAFVPSDGSRAIGGVAYDQSTGKVYISQLAADKPGLEPFPLIQIFHVNAEIDTVAPTMPSGLNVL